jgi:arylsulfatase A-like enzyme
MRKKSFTRRDFLKTAALTSFAGLTTLIKQSQHRFISQKQNSPNILILLLDSLSARHISLHGYPKETMPNLVKFAQKSTLFHKHYSAGNFTSPATASLLTGTYPWIHRAFHMFVKMEDQFTNKNIFSVLPSNYTTFGYTQNILVEIMLDQCKMWIDEHPKVEEITLINERAATTRRDYEYSLWGEKIARGELLDIKSALYLGTLIDLIHQLLYKQKITPFHGEYPLGVPINNSGTSFVLRDVFDWLEQEIGLLSLPYFGYVHLYPPHEPYRPSKEFINYLKDAQIRPSKLEHVFSEDRPEQFLTEAIQIYDQFLAYTDHEIGLFLKWLEESGKLENTYVIITSDHGELFERGIWGHLTPVMYEPLIHIPLLIHKPGQTAREDVETPTSIIDILPTVCQVTGQPVPDWVEGEILPSFSTPPPNPERMIFSLEAKRSSKFKPLNIGTLVMIQWPYKLIHYFGYDEIPEGYELYHLEEDPEEMDDLFEQMPEVAGPMKKALLAKFNDVNQSYQQQP